MKKTIKVSVADRNGHSDLEFQTPSAAIEALKQEEANARWVYIDGRHVSTDRLSESDIVAANDIKVVPRLMGG